MNVIAALAFGLVLGAGAHLLVRRELVRLAAGAVLMSNAAVLLLVSAGFGARQTPLLPVDPDQAADPVVQALAITAIVIAFGVTVLLLRVAAALHDSHGSLDLKEIQKAEIVEELRLEAGGDGSDRARASDTRDDPSQGRDGRPGEGAPP